ncbi:MAG: DNA replication and repair protein RecF [Fibrobacteraceae bacterium]
MIHSIHLASVRNLEDMDLSIGDGVTVISGRNGVGKTTILEAVHLLCQGFSFRSRDLRDLIRWDSPEMMMRGELILNDVQSVRAFRLNRSQSLVAKIDGVECKSLSAFFGSSPAVIMEPADIELVRGAPEERRHWMDEILCFRKASNMDTLRRYRRILAQRNQWLRQNRQGVSCAVGGEALLQVLTHQLIDLGADIWRERLELVYEVSGIISAYYKTLANGTDEITCGYKSAVVSDQVPMDIETVKLTFAEKLESLESAERLQGVTLAGPHKDDFTLCSSGHELRSVGSQGQCRSAAIAMRFASVDVANTHLISPVLLLDDVFAELDLVRRGAVADVIREKKCQVLVATPRAEDLPFTPDHEIRMQ